MKFGLMLTDAKLWSSVNDMVREKAEDASDVLRDHYETAAERLDRSRAALRGETDWVVPVASFVGGIGIGIGLGMLFTPVTGSEARAVLRDSAVGIKNKVTDVTSGTKVRATGT